MTEQSGRIGLARERIAAEARSVEAIAEHLDDSFTRVVELLLDLPGKVFFTGSGTSGIMARRAAHILTVCGTPALYLQPMDALHGSMGAVTRDDVLIAISRGGSSSELNDLVRRVRLVGAPTVALTSAPDSELAQAADISVTLHVTPDCDPGAVIAMGSTLAVGAWTDALAYVLMATKGYGWEQVLQNHPAGAVGMVTELPPAVTLPDQTSLDLVPPDLAPPDLS